MAAALFFIGKDVVVMRRSDSGGGRMVCRRRSCRDPVARPAGSAAGPPRAVAAADDLALAQAADPVAGCRAAASCR